MEATPLLFFCFLPLFAKEKPPKGAIAARVFAPERYGFAFSISFYSLPVALAIGSRIRTRTRTENINPKGEIARSVPFCRQKARARV